jgi:hypothetical protein
MYWRKDRQTEASDGARSVPGGIHPGNDLILEVSDENTFLKG